MREELAKTLWEIHSKQFPEWDRYSDDVGHYPGEEDLSWETLAEKKDDDSNLVSKDYFRKLADAVIERLGL